MCGITGFWTTDVFTGDARGVLEKMSNAIRHRGPDGDGFWNAKGVHFAHRRLAIVDLTPTGLQPMHS